MSLSPEQFAFDDETATNIAVGLIRRGEVLFGDFTLRSGLWSPFYTDLRPTASAIENNSNAPTMTKADQIQFRNSVVSGYAGMVSLLDDQLEHITAIPEAVLGLGPMVAHELGISYFQRRIKAKDYGRPSEGILSDYNEGDRVGMLDDLISSSGAKIDEKNLLEDMSRPGHEEDETRGMGVIIEHACILLDRETGGVEAAREQGLQVWAGLTFSKVLVIGEAEGAISRANFNVSQAYIAGDLTRKEDAPAFM